MPCTLTGSQDGDALYYAQQDKRAAQKELLKATQMLCLACKTMESQNVEIPDKIKEWWKVHKYQDKTRGLPKYN